MKLRGACIQTHNIKTLVDFYKKIFEQEPVVDGGVDYRFYDTQLVVFKLDNENAPSTKNVALIYSVDDVDYEYLRLINMNIAIEHPPTDKLWGVRSFVVNDPDGNTVSFVKDLSE